ncbi:AAA family ATPase [Alicyclobacillus sp. ALC3]|nr:AAA family ATPase [Alicyclobacillus sp. ALC3]
MAAGFNPEGGGRGNTFATAHTESILYQHLKLSWLPKATRGFFLRAESFFNFATYIEEIEKEPYGSTGFALYGGKSLHERSHGESFFALITNRFQSGQSSSASNRATRESSSASNRATPQSASSSSRVKNQAASSSRQPKNRRVEKALYLLDEPEAALSPTHQLALLRILRDLEESGNAQVIIATHSPILLGYPHARILNFDTSPLSDIAYEETDHYAVTKEFLNHRDRLLAELFSDDPDG